jgi:hypothetical protein
LVRRNSGEASETKRSKEINQASSEAAESKEKGGTSASAAAAAQEGGGRTEKVYTYRPTYLPSYRILKID